MTIANIQDHERYVAQLRTMDATDAELRAAIDAIRARVMTPRVTRSPALPAARAALDIVRRAEVLRTDRAMIDLRIPFDSYDALLDALYDAGLIVDGECQ